MKSSLGYLFLSASEIPVKMSTAVSEITITMIWVQEAYHVIDKQYSELYECTA